MALAAQLLGIQATVFMPEGAPIPKVNATRGYGAEVRFHGEYLTQALVAAQEFADETGAVFIHPFDHTDIVAGQGTAGLEILAQAPQAATVLVPTGGGGLIAGVAIAVKALRPDVRVVGVQAEEAAAYPESLRRGSPVALERMTTMADGIAVACPGDVPFAAIQAARRRGGHRLRGVDVTRAGAAARARQDGGRAVRRGRRRGDAGPARRRSRTPIVAVLSGGNVDPLLLGNLIRHGMASSGRYLNIRCVIPDRPGGLARLLAELADSGANVLEVSHERTSTALHIGEVEVHLQLETKGPDHAEDVISRLREHGWHVTPGP